MSATTDVIAREAVKQLPQVRAVTGAVKRAVYAYLLDVTGLAAPDARGSQAEPVTCHRPFGAYVTPHYLAAALDVTPNAVTKAFRELTGVIPELTVLGAETRIHEFSPMTLTKPLDCEGGFVSPLPVQDVGDTCPYGGLVAHRKTAKGPETAYHARVHKGDMREYLGYEDCPFEMFYHPVTNPEATEIGCRAIRSSDSASDLYTMRLHVPTGWGWRRHSVSHPMFHVYYPEVLERDCPFRDGHVDKAEYPWSDLNPANRERLEKWKREQDQVAQGGQKSSVGRLRAFLTAPTVAEGLQRALHS